MLFLTKNDYDKILKHCEAGLPDEACGLIGGTKDGNDKYIKKVYLLTNIDHSNEHFSMDPKEQLQAVKDMRQNGLELLGNFHSEEDKRLAYDSKVNYLILSLMDRENPVLKAFIIDEEKNVTIEEIKITE